MKLKNILGYRDFLLQKDINSKIKDSPRYTNNEIESAISFYFFSTSIQRTWFVATKIRAYIILDDARKETIYTKVNKSYDLKDLITHNKLNIKFDSSYKDQIGKIFFPRSSRGWLYSKKLFPSEKSLSDKFHIILSQYNTN